MEIKEIIKKVLRQRKKKSPDEIRKQIIEMGKIMETEGFKMIEEQIEERLVLVIGQIIIARDEKELKYLQGRYEGIREIREMIKKIKERADNLRKEAREG